MPQPKLKRLHGRTRILDADSPYTGPYADDIAELRVKLARLLEISMTVVEVEAEGASLLMVGMVQGVDLLIEGATNEAMQAYRAIGAPFGDNQDGLDRWIAQRTSERAA